MLDRISRWPYNITMKKHPDINELSASIVAKATHEKNPAAIALGRLGGLKGGKARAKALTPKQRQDIARKAAKKRWEKKDQ